MKTIMMTLLAAVVVALAIPSLSYAACADQDGNSGRQYGVRDNACQSRSGGHERACEAKLHVCFAPTPGVEIINPDPSNPPGIQVCKSACQDTSKNFGCDTTNCESRCDGWLGASDTCD